MPEQARSKMGNSFRSLLKIAEAEAAGRTDTRWKLAEVQYDMRIFRKMCLTDDGKSMNAFRAMTTVDATPEDISNVIMNFAHSKRWIPAMREMRVLKNLDDNTDVVYLGRQKRKPSDLWSTRRSPAQLAATVVALFLIVGGTLMLLGGQLSEGMARILLGLIFFVTSSDRLAVWPRDLVLMRHRHAVSDKTIVIGLRSVADESCPPRNAWALVRGELTGGGFIIQGLENGKSRLSFISQADFKGWAGIYGSYGMHLEQMSLLITLKNYIHSEITPVAVGVKKPVSTAAISASPPTAQPPVTLVQNNLSNNNNNNNDLKPLSVKMGNDFFGGKDQDVFGTSVSVNFLQSPVAPPKTSSRVLKLATSNEDDDVHVESTMDARQYPVRVSYEVPRPSRYGDEAVQNREEALKLATEGTSDGWSVVNTVKGVAIMQKKMGEGKPTMVRGVLKGVSGCPGAILATVMNLEKKAQWDAMFAKGHVIEEIDDFTCVQYERFHPIFPTSGRDFCLMYSLNKRSDGAYVRSVVSVEHAECPEVSGLVRATLLHGSLVISPNAEDANSSDLMYTVWVDLKGSMPQWIVARVATDQPMVIASMRDMIAKEDIDLSHDPLAAKFDRVKLVKGGPPQVSAPIPVGGSSSVAVASGNAATAETPMAKEDVPDINQMAWEVQHGGPAATTPLVAASSDADRSLTMEDSAVPSPAASGHLTEPELLKLFATPKSKEKSAEDTAILSRTFKLLLHAAADKSSAWVNRGVHEDVVIMSRAPSESSSIQSFKGYGPIDAPASKVMEVVHDLSSQSKWDPLFKFGMIVEKYDEHTDLRYVVYQAQQCLVKASRNFVYILGTKQLPDGTILLAAVSKDRPDLPVFKGAVRGTIEASGWVIQPFPKDKDKCMCTYVSTVDLGGLPMAIVNIVASKQPLLIASVRKLLTGSKEASQKQ